MEGMFMFFFFAIFAFVIGMFIFIIVSSAGRWIKNNNSPRLNVNADVVAKRMQVGSHMHDNSHFANSGYTRYFVTFQFESGDRLELNVSPEEYGILVEGDKGVLEFQGTRFLNFKRV
ncbi:MAG: DUF2500 domain-containing protein [Firmicutes bacterium]|nr:DUF2500 domain-containing protein [Bacillota bacterium]